MLVAVMVHQDVAYVAAYHSAATADTVAQGRPNSSGVAHQFKFV